LNFIKKISEHYEGELASTSRGYDLEGIPIDQHVSVYHSGRSDEAQPKAVEETIAAAEPGESFIDRVTGLFKSRAAHEDFPALSAPYEGEYATTSKAYEVEPSALDTHVQVVSPGYYDVLPKPVVEEVPREEGPGFVDRLTGLFKKPAHQDYPVSTPYLGDYAETSLYRDVEGMPIQEKVSVYHSGKSDEIPPKVEAVEAPEQPSEGLLGKITGVFKRHHEEDYPTITEPYTGPLGAVHRAYDLEGVPFDTVGVTPYHSGESVGAVAVVKTEKAEEGPSAVAKLTGFFKRGPAHQDYPISGKKSIIKI